MRTQTLVAACAVAGTLALGALVFSQGKQLETGTKAPAFSAKGSDGKTHTLASLTAKGPVYLYFIKEDCPINDQAVKYYNRVGDAYKGKATMVGVFDGGEAAYKKWAAKFKPTYPVLFDPNKTIIRSYRAERSPWVIQVDAKGQVAKVWPGYSEKDLNQLSASMAGAAKTQPQKIDFSGAPGSTRYG
jgi:peroxiredoxin